MSDRLGGLPDDVICHILSFLPLKPSAQTSLLSKSWRSLWAHVQFLEFRSKDYRNSKTPARKILNHIVLTQHHHHHIHTVRLDYRAHDSTDSDLESWIAHFASRNVRSLFIRLDDHLALPRRLFGRISCIRAKFWRLSIPDSDFSAFTVKFRNLTELDLCADIRFITTFLENANSLRVLKLKFRKVDIDDQYCWMEPKQVPACLISHLKTVRIIGFGCSKEHEFEVIGYVLVNAQVLKRMKIYSRYRLDWKMKFDALKRIFLFERGSRACELDFYWDGSGIRLSKLSRKTVC